MGQLFSLLGNTTTGGMLGGIASLAGGIMGFMGGQSAAAAASDQANASAAISAYTYQEGAAKYALASSVAQRQVLQQQRNAQVAVAKSRAAQVNQGQGGQSLAQGSSQGGALGTIRGQESSNIQGINQQFGTYKQLFGLQGDIYSQQLRMAADQTSIAQSQGIMQEGNAIAGFGKAAGQLLPDFATMFGLNNSPPGGGQTIDMSTSEDANIAGGVGG